MAQTQLDNGAGFLITQYARLVLGSAAIEYDQRRRYPQPQHALQIVRLAADRVSCRRPLMGSSSSRRGGGRCDFMAGTGLHSSGGCIVSQAMGCYQ